MSSNNVVLYSVGFWLSTTNYQSHNEPTYYQTTKNNFIQEKNYQSRNQPTTNNQQSITISATPLTQPTYHKHPTINTNSIHSHTTLHNAQIRKMHPQPHNQPPEPTKQGGLEQGVTSRPSPWQCAPPAAGGGESQRRVR